MLRNKQVTAFISEKAFGKKKGGGMNSSHRKIWASEVLKINRMLSGCMGTTGQNPQEDELWIGKVRVRRVMTLSEEEEMNEVAEIDEPL